MTTYELLARDRKASILADFLHQHGINGDKARLMTKDEWAVTALCCSTSLGINVRPPHSEATRQAIYALLDAKERYAPISIEKWKLATETIQ